MADIASLFLPSKRGSAVAPTFGAVLTSWSPPNNTVQIGDSTVFTDLPYLDVPMTVGNVLMLNTPSGPIILGNVRQAG